MTIRIILSTISLAASLPAADQPPPAAAAPVAELPASVVTATRSPADPQNVPQPVYAVDQEYLDRAIIRTLPESLREQPGVLVQKTAHGQGSPFIRGFTGYRTLAMVDGIRYNNSILREGPNEYWALLDPYSLSGYELVPGAGSTLYGSDAVGGTLNSFTKRSDYTAEEDGKFYTHGSAFYRWQSAEQSNTGRVEAQLGQGGSWGLHLGFSEKDFGDVDAADIGEQPHTGYGARAWDARLDIQLAEHWTFTAAHQQTRQEDAWRTHSTIYALPFAGTVAGSDLVRSFDHERSLSYARLEGTELDSFVNAARITFSWQTLEERQFRVKKDRAREVSGLELGTFGAELQLQSETPLGHLTWGADYYRDSVDSFRTDYSDKGVRTRRIQGPVGDDSSYDLAGVFLQNQSDLSDRVDLHVGARYTYASADVGKYEDPETKKAASLSQSWDQFTGSARLVVHLDEKENLNLFGGVAQSFRAPNLSDLTRLDIARSSEIETPSTALDPEEFLTYELGLKARGESASASIAYYYTDIQSLIVRTPTGRVVGENREVGKASDGEGYVHGAELAGEWEFSDGWTLFGNVAWQEGEADTYPTSAKKKSREPVSRMLPLSGTAGVRWTRGDGKVWTELVCTASDRADRLNTADRADTQRIPPDGTPGYVLLGLRGGWHVTDNLTVLASLENLLDESWRAHGSGSNEPGFGGSVAVKLAF